MVKAKKLSQKHIDMIVDIMAEEALASQLGPERYFQNLVRSANLPTKFRIERESGWTGDPAYSLYGNVTLKLDCLKRGTLARFTAF